MGFFIGFLIGLFLLFGWPIIYIPIMIFMNIQDGIRSRKENKRIDELEKETEKQWAIKRAQEEELRERNRALRERIRAGYKKEQEKKVQVDYIAPDEWVKRNITWIESKVTSGKNFSINQAFIKGANMEEVALLLHKAFIGRVASVTVLPDSILVNMSDLAQEGYDEGRAESAT